MARSHYRGTVYGNLTTGTKPLPGAAVRLYHPDTGQPWALPVYPDAVNGVPHAMPILTDPVGEWEVWADEPARVRASVDHPSFYSVGEVVEIRPDPETAATDEDVAESVEDHEAKEDPHDQYLTEEEGNLLYKPLPWEPDLSDYYTRGEADDEFLDQDEADLRYEQLSRKGLPLGYAPLDFAGFVPNQYLPPLAITETFVCISEAEMLALPAQQGDVAVRLDTTENYILRVDPATVLANWTKLAASTTAGNTSVLRREEFTPSPLATTVTLAAPPTTVHAVSRNGVGQSEPAGHYSLSGLVLTFTDPFELGERVAVVYEIGSTVPAPVNGYTKEESDLRYEPIDTMYTKGESDAKYLTQALGDARYSLIHTHPYLPLAGGDLTGPLTIQTKPVNVSPDSGNALVWRSNGFYSSGSGGNVTVVNREEFFPAAAATTVTLAQAPSEILSVSRNGVEQFASAGDYSVAGAVVTFTSAFVAGERVSVLSEVGTSVPVDAYTTAQSEARYVNVTGDQMSGVLRVDANVGLSVAPEASWRTDYRVVRVGQVGAFVSGTGNFDVEMVSNSVFTATDSKAIVTGEASQLQTLAGYLRYHTAPSVAAGATQTFTQRMEIAPTGTLSLFPGIVDTSLNITGMSGVGMAVRAAGAPYSAKFGQLTTTGLEFGANLWWNLPTGWYKEVANQPGVIHRHLTGGDTGAFWEVQTVRQAEAAGSAKVRLRLWGNGAFTINADADVAGLTISGAAGGSSSFTSRNDGVNVWYTTGYAIVDPQTNIFGPLRDNVISCGSAQNRFSVVYAGAGAISTSSLKYKDPEGDLDPELALRAVLRTPARRFRYKGTQRLQAGYYLEEADPLFTIGPDEASPSNDAGILMAALQAICTRLGISI